MCKKVYILFLFATSFVFAANAQNMSINKDGSAPDPSAMLDVSDTTRGFLPPRLNTTQMNNVISPATGLMIFNTDSAGYFFYDGASWLSISSLSPTPSTIDSSSESGIVILTDEKSSGTDGGTFTAGSWQTRDINTKSGDTSFVTIASNEFTLNEGVYLIEASAPAFRVGLHRSRIYNVTDAAVAIRGQNQYSINNSSADQTNATLSGVIDISSNKTFRLEHRGQSTQAANGFGATHAISGEEDIYSTIKIIKLDQVFGSGVNSGSSASDTLNLIRDADRNSQVIITNDSIFLSNNGKSTVNISETGGVIVNDPGSSPSGSFVSLSSPGANSGIAVTQGDGAGSILQRWNMAVYNDSSLQFYPHGRDATLTLSNDGYVGIGSTSPTVPLAIKSITTVVDNPGPLSINSSSNQQYTEGIRITSDSLDSGDDLAIAIGKEGTTNNIGWIGYRYVGDGLDSNALVFNLWNRKRILNITGQRRVGINTLTPEKDLDINGAATIDTLNINSAYTLPSNAPTSGQVLRYNGSEVEWGTATAAAPTEIQDTDGNTQIQVEESTNDDIIRFDMSGTEFFRMDSGRIEVVNTGNSIFMGDSAGFSDDYSNNENIYFGSNAGRFNTTGFRNIAIGVNALEQNISGYDNIALGYRAGNENLAHTNILIGNNTSDGSNVMNTSVLIGHDILTNSSSGNLNSIVGHYALANITSGHSNSIVGFEAGNDLTQSTANVLIGRDALGNANTADSNVVIGFEAGKAASNLKRSVLIGNQSGTNASGNDKLYIENTATAQPLIYGNFAGDSVKIYGTLSIGDSTTFPTTRGTNGQVLTSDGIGGISWQNASGATPTLSTILSAGKDAGADSIFNLNALNIGNTRAPKTSLEVDSFMVMMGEPYFNTRWIGFNAYYDGVSPSAQYLNDGYADLLLYGNEKFIMAHFETSTADANLPNNALTEVTLEDSSITLNGQATNLDISLRGNVTADSLRINGLYSFPNTSPTLGQVLRYNGSEVEWGTATAATPTEIQDTDGNTQIQAEEGANDDIIRFDMSGTEFFRMDSGRFEVVNTGNSVFLGDSAGYNDDYSGNINTLVGFAAGKSLTTGEENVLVGWRAGREATGSYNVAIGGEALLNGGNNDQNTAVGDWAMRLSQGALNVGIGAEALYENSGSENVAIGYLAFSNTSGGSGNRNVAIGPGAGAENSGSDNIFIGNLAGNSIGTVNNSLYIDNSGTSTPLIYGDFAADSLRFNGIVETSTDLYIPSGNVGIGTTSPNTLLHLNKNVGSSTNDGTFIDIQNSSGVSGSLSGIRFKNNSSTTNIRYQGAIFHQWNGSEFQLNFAVRDNSATDVVDKDDIRMTINELGEVGIGTTNPNQELDVEGDIEIDGDYTYESARTDYFSISSAGFTPLQGVSGSNATQGLEIGGFDTGNSRWIAGGTTNDAGYMYAPVSLPNGASITALEVYVYDNDNTAEVSATLYRQTLGGSSINALTTTGSTGVAAVPTVTTVSATGLSLTVDNSLYSYYIRLNTEENNSQLRIFSARITYTVTKAN